MRASPIVFAGASASSPPALRSQAPTFGQTHGIELSDENGRALWIPAGFAHGFCVLGDEPADVLYKVDVPYQPAGEGGIYWADPELAIAWPVKNPLVSARDGELPGFAAYRREPVFEWRSGQEGRGEGAEARFAAMCGTDAATYQRERPGLSAFVLEDGAVFHTYSAYARGVDGIWGAYQWLDRAPKGRNETGVWWRRHDEYGQRPR